MTKIYAHRGASGLAPENTMEAFLLAIEQGCDGIELDVHLTKDLVPVVMHDETLDRTSNGKGYIKDYTFDELLKLDCNNHMLTLKQCKIPSLEEVIKLVKANNILLNIELKTDKIHYSNIEEIVLELVEKYHYQDFIQYSSFNPRSLMIIKEKKPKAYCGLIYNVKNNEIFEVAEKMGIDGLHPRYTLVDHKYIKKCREHHLIINTWTVNDYDNLQKQIDFGVDGIITNYPLRGKELIK